MMRNIGIKDKGMNDMCDKELNIPIDTNGTVIVDDIPSDDGSNELSEERTSRTFTIKLDVIKIRQLRDAINSKVYLSINKLHEGGKKPSWNQMCATLDRIDDIIDYLNSLKLNIGRYTRSAFDFYDFMNQSSVLIECIDSMATIYDVDLNEENTSCNCFMTHMPEKIKTDKKYYEYIRSLCSVHPGNTDRQKKVSESCPFVVWTHPPLDDKGDLFALVYVNDREHTEHSMYISIREIFDFVEKRVGIVDKIVKGILEYNEAEITKLREIPLKSKSVFSSSSEYLEYLAQEKIGRFPEQGDYEIRFVQDALKINMSIGENEPLYKSYCEALLYAIGFEHNRLQQMSDGTEYDCSGVKSGDDTLLDLLVHSVCNDFGGNECGYAYEKMYHLNYDGKHNDDGDWARCQILMKKDHFLNNVTYSDEIGDKELFYLVHANIYANNLKIDSVINASMPSNNIYRITEKNYMSG